MSKELKTGIIVLLIIALGVWGVGFLKDQSIFEGTKRYFIVEYNNVEGLSPVSIVTINGKPVGKVSKINFNPDNKTKVLVEFVMDDEITFSKTSVAKMYTASMVTGGQNIAIVPRFDGTQAQSGDTLVGTKDAGMMSVVKNQLAPLQEKVSKVLVNAEKLLASVNTILDEKAQKSINRSVINFETTVNQLNRAIGNVNSLLNASKSNITSTFENSKKITEDFSKLSSKLADTDLGNTIAEFEKTIKGVNTLISEMKNGKGTLGKLMTDDKMYVNLTKASKELEELLREMKLNPKRFVHFSLFGKKAKSFDKDKSDTNTSNK